MHLTPYKELFQKCFIPQVPVNIVQEPKLEDRAQGLQLHTEGKSLPPEIVHGYQKKTCSWLAIKSFFSNALSTRTPNTDVKHLSATNFLKYLPPLLNLPCWSSAIICTGQWTWSLGYVLSLKYCPRECIYAQSPKLRFRAHKHFSTSSLKRCYIIFSLPTF